MNKIPTSTEPRYLTSKEQVFVLTAASSLGQVTVLNIEIQNKNHGVVRIGECLVLKKAQPLRMHS